MSGCRQSGHAAINISRLMSPGVVFACIFIVCSNECVSLTISRGSSSVLRVIARAAVAVTHAIQMILISRLVLWDPSAVIILTAPHVIGAVIKANAT